MTDSPAVSLVIPLFNEADNVRSLAETLTSGLQGAGIDFELVLVDNGSSDGTGRLLDELAASDPRVRKVDVPKNRGYGHGILTGLSAARGHRVAFMCGDLQVGEADVAKILGHAIEGDFDLVKATRVARHDGLKRRFFSMGLNVLVPLFFRTLGRDVNGTPKVLTRELYHALRLDSERWFIDAELMIKASTRKDLKFSEIPVVFHPRRGGRSTVRCLRASLEFLSEMMRYRLFDLARYRVRAQAEASTPGLSPADG